MEIGENRKTIKERERRAKIRRIGLHFSDNLERDEGLWKALLEYAYSAANVQPTLYCGHFDHSGLSHSPSCVAEALWITAGKHEVSCE